MSKNDTLIALGFFDAHISELAEVANETEGIHKFQVVQNVEKKDPWRPYECPDFQFSYFSHSEFDFSGQGNNYHFGVFDAPVKAIIFHWFEKNYGIARDRYASFVHPKTYVSRSARFEHGFFLEPMSVVSTFTSIGFGVTIKRGSIIGHHNHIGDFVTINPGASIAGTVTIGEGATIGLGAVINNRVTIGKGSLIGSGSVVTKDIPEGVIAYGNPCRVMRTNDRWFSALESLKNMET